jgi:rSAM/selenodomain-associated transferase 1
MTDDALILFFRYPERGRVKTRLAASFGEDFALGLYVSFVKDILAMAASVSTDIVIITDVYGDVPQHLLGMGTGYPVMRQKGKDIGTRMLNAFLQIFDMGYQRAVLIGSDSPDLPAEFIQRALNSLLTYDVVLGNSADGGYYLIGFTRGTCLTEFFCGVSWGTSLVFQETIDKIIESGKSIYFLPEWYDIDEKDDLIRFYNQKSQEDNSLYTVQFLDRNMKNAVKC